MEFNSGFKGLKTTYDVISYNKTN